MNKSSVDIAVITYNQEAFIEKTLQSILNQSYDNINRIIVTDDGSTDNTPRIIEEYSLNNLRIKPILAKENKGIAYNMNRALKHVDAEYVTFIAGDDIMCPGKIEKQVKYLNLNRDLVACGHDMDVFNSATGESLGKFSDIISFKKIKGELNVKSFFNPSLFIGASSVIYRTVKIPKNGFDIRLKYLNDFLFNVEVLINGNLGFIDEVLGRYRLHSNNITSNEDAQMLAFEDSLIAFSIIVSRYPELVNPVKKRKQALYMNQILKSIKDGNKDRAKILSKVLISEGSYFKGITGYLLSKMLNRERVNNLYQNRGLLKFLLKFF